MTIIAPRHTAVAPNNAQRSRCPVPAAVWDIPDVSVRNARGGAVRSLGGDVRTGDCSNEGPDSVQGTVHLSRHESRASALMGAGFGLALLVGSALGGILDTSPEPAVPASAPSTSFATSGR
ncbi:hypothetical protein SAMN04488539_0739 [Corynebacterium timonense]|uniref:Uncharacterized protein n=1 Tax=Corynebacterium timonense TaxID=441500 RepID=A0A1H1NDD2_9CORY|nr:hypothetical protein SAMN04488539_0739 [Corynebacterium timonense]